MMVVSKGLGGKSEQHREAIVANCDRERSQGKCHRNNTAQHLCVYHYRSDNFSKLALVQARALQLVPTKVLGKGEKSEVRARSPAK